MEFSFKGTTERNKHEQIAMRNIKHACNWIIGGYYNMYQDDNLTEELTMESLETEIYETSLVDWYGVGSVKYDCAPKEMRFAGEEFIRAYIRYILSNDSDVEEIISK